MQCGCCANRLRIWWLEEAKCGKEIKSTDYISAGVPNQKDIHVHSLPCEWYDNEGTFVIKNSMELENDMSEDLLSKALSHIVEEIGITNMKISLENNFEEIQKAHGSIHEFIYLAPLCVPSTVKTSWHSKSAFLTYHWGTFHSAHRSLLEALEGYYNPAYTLLRNTLELLARGAFWESLAHKKFRDNTKIIDKFKGNKKRKSVKDWIEDLIKQEPSIEKELEETSGAIFDKIAILFDDIEFQKRCIWMPSFSLIVEQLIEWNIVDISEAHSVIYSNLYHDLSKDVHVIPDKTDVGRKLIQDKNIFETVVDPDELSKYLKILHKIMDIGIVIELNILGDWIKQDEEVKTRLEERIQAIDELGLELSSEKLKSLWKTHAKLDPKPRTMYEASRELKNHYKYNYCAYTY